MINKHEIEALKKYLNENTEDSPRIARSFLEDSIPMLEKQMPEKIILNSEEGREYEDYICPNCKDILRQRRKLATAIMVHEYKFCPDCGQKLDWKYGR